MISFKHLVIGASVIVPPFLSPVFAPSPSTSSSEAIQNPASASNTDVSTVQTGSSPDVPFPDSLDGLKDELDIPGSNHSGTPAPKLQSTEEILEDEYDFSRSDLKPSDVAPYYDRARPPSTILYFNEPGSPEVLSRKNRKKGGEIVLSFSNQALAGRIAFERSKDAKLAGAATGPSTAPNTSYLPLGEDAWRVLRFTPGKTGQGKPIALRKSPSEALQGPDFSLDALNEEDPGSLLKIQSKVLSFGHSGELLLSIEDGGVLLDGAGADLVLYENVFPIGGDKLYQEFARVGVSESLDENSFRWFDCLPEQGRLKGCAGVVPTVEGGDAFDLAAVGMQKARFIKIRDWGKNYNNSGVNTEGFDLDAVRLLHAFKPVQN